MMARQHSLLDSLWFARRQMHWSSLQGVLAISWCTLWPDMQNKCHCITFVSYAGMGCEIFIFIYSDASCF